MIPITGTNQEYSRGLTKDIPYSTNMWAFFHEIELYVIYSTLLWESARQTGTFPQQGGPKMSFLVLVSKID